MQLAFGPLAAGAATAVTTGPVAAAAIVAATAAATAVSELPQQQLLQQHVSGIDADMEIMNGSDNVHDDVHALGMSTVFATSDKE
jgi:hypothetical protein